MAACSPTACAIGGVPASNRYGGGANVDPVMRTTSIISPPPRNGGRLSSSSYRPQSTPIPVGPQILWPVKARRSQPRSATDVGSCGTPWEASTTITAPTACAMAATCATGLIVPSTLLTHVIDTTFVRSLITVSYTH